MNKEVVIKAIKKLEEYKQYKTIKILENIENDDKEKLANNILNMDFDRIINIYNDSILKDNKEEQIKVDSIPYIDKEKLTDDEKDKYIKTGEEIIKLKKYAIVTMAGGQGTRLGHNGPKGTFYLNTINGKKSLFEILCDRLKDAKNEYGVSIPWYIMTSKENNKATVDFFEENKYFGYDKEKVKFFIQNELPLLDKSGEILIDEKYNVKEAGSGNGEVFVGLKDSKILEELEKENIEWIFIGGVDNVLLNMVDVLFVGATSYNKNLVASKSVAKLYPEERVGVFCKKNGKNAIIEYTELAEELRIKRDENGELLYGEGNILNHLYNIKALQKIVEQKLPYHVAVKKNTYINDKLELIEPKEPNAYKFESFIFDSLALFDDILLLRVKREEEFAPVKNAEGNDSPVTAEKLYNDFYKK